MAKLIVVPLEALKVNTTLEKLSISINDIGDAGAQAIAEALKKNKTLITLYINITFS